MPQSVGILIQTASGDGGGGSGLPVWRSTGTAATSTSVATLQSVMPSGWQLGDRLLMDLLHSGDDTATITTNLTSLGWTLEANAKAGFGQLWRYSKPAGSSESAPSVTFSTSSELVIHITAIANAGTADPSLSVADTTAANTTPITAPSITVDANSLVVVAYGARVAAPPMAAVTPDGDYTERVETASTNSTGAGVTLELATRGPTTAGTLSGDTWAPTLAARDVLIITEIKAPGGNVNDYGFPSYSTLMARSNKINVAATQGAETYSQVTYGTGIGADCTLNIEGWKGRPNGGVNGLNWAGGWTYVVGDMVEPTTSNGRAYKCTTAGVSAGTEGTWPAAGVGNTKTSNTAVFTDVGATTSSNPTALSVGSFNPGINGVSKLAILGSSAATSSANVGRIQGLGFNNTQNLFPIDCYLWSWKDRKGLGQSSDPSGTWTGPNLDEHAVRISTNDPGDGSWSCIVDGVAFIHCNDSVGMGSQASARTIFRNCLFLNIGDDCNEADFNNNSSEYYDCLFLNVYTILSTTGSRNASAEQSLLKNCIVIFNHLPRQTGTTGITCPGIALRDLTSTEGEYWAHGVTYKQPSTNCPRFRLEDTQLFIPGYSAACRDGTGLSGSTFASASNTTLLFGRGKATTAGNGVTVPQATSGLEDWAAGGAAFMPTGVTITNDSTSGYETAKATAIDNWIGGSGGHNAHPQFAGLI